MEGRASIRALILPVVLLVAGCEAQEPAERAGPGAAGEPAEAASSAQQPDLDRAPGDSAAVVAVVDRFHAALAEGDTAAVQGLLTADALVLESGGLEDREEYFSHHLPADMEFAAAVERERRPVRVEIRGDVAWAMATSTATGSFRERAVDSDGAELMVLTRAGGDWRIAAIHWSSRSSR